MNLYDVISRGNQVNASEEESHPLAKDLLRSGLDYDYKKSKGSHVFKVQHGSKDSIDTGKELLSSADMVKRLAKKHGAEHASKIKGRYIHHTLTVR